MSLFAEPVWPRVQSIDVIAFDFDGVFTDNKVYVGADGAELVRCDRADGLAIDMLRRYRDRQRSALDLFILSTERHGVVAARAAKLQLTCYQGVGNKGDFLTDYLKRTRPDAPSPFTGVLYVGNDLNDLACIRMAEFSVVPSDAHPVVKQHASAVLPQAGGCGFVRALVERLLGVETMSAGEVYELVSDR